MKNLKRFLCLVMVAILSVFGGSFVNPAFAYCENHEEESRLITFSVYGRYNDTLMTRLDELARRNETFIIRAGETREIPDVKVISLERLENVRCASPLAPYFEGMPALSRGEGTRNDYEITFQAHISKRNYNSNVIEPRLMEMGLDADGVPIYWASTSRSNVSAMLVSLNDPTFVIAIDMPPVF